MKSLNIQEEIANIIRENVWLDKHGMTSPDIIAEKINSAYKSYYSSLVGEEELLTDEEITTAFTKAVYEEACSSKFPKDPVHVGQRAIVRKAAAKKTACILARMKPIEPDPSTLSQALLDRVAYKSGVQAQFSADQRAVKGGE